MKKKSDSTVSGLKSFVRKTDLKVNSRCSMNNNFSVWGSTLQVILSTALSYTILNNVEQYYWINNIEQ